MLDQETSGQVSPRRRAWRIGVIAAATVGLLAIAGGLLVVVTSSDRTLQLEVTSPGGEASYINWSGPDDRNEIHDEAPGRTVDLPWRTTIDVSASDGVIRLNAGAANGPAVTCRILRDDVVLAEQKATGQVNCMVSVKRAFNSTS